MIRIEVVVTTCTSKGVEEARAGIEEPLGQYRPLVEEYLAFVHKEKEDNKLQDETLRVGHGF